MKSTKEEEKAFIKGFIAFLMSADDEPVKIKIKKTPKTKTK